MNFSLLDLALFFYEFTREAIRGAGSLTFDKHISMAAAIDLSGSSNFGYKEYPVDDGDKMGRTQKHGSGALRAPRNERRGYPPLTIHCLRCSVDKLVADLPYNTVIVPKYPTPIFLFSSPKISPLLPDVRVRGECCQVYGSPRTAGGIRRNEKGSSSSWWIPASEETTQSRVGFP